MYRVEYSPAAEEHLWDLSPRQRATELDSVEEQLAFQLNVETRHRKPMRPNPLAPWELRINELRVYYDMESDPEPVVTVLAVGIKSRNRVAIGKKEIQL